MEAFQGGQALLVVREGLVVVEVETVQLDVAFEQAVEIHLAHRTTSLDRRLSLEPRLGRILV